MATASMYEHMVEVLGSRIVNGVLSSGEAMSLADLEQEFGVSRTVAREAMRALQGLGMITAQRRIGLVVSPSTEWDMLDPHMIRWHLSGDRRDRELLDLMDLRVAIEPTAARLAAQHASDEERQQLLRLVTRLNELGSAGEGDSEEYLELDVEFHVTLLRASQNPMLAALEPAITGVLRGRAELGLTPADPDPLATACHISTAHAVAEGNLQAAEDALRTLLTLVRDEVL